MYRRFLIFMDLFEFDGYFGKKQINIAGVDESGRGPWAGPVVAAAVILPRNIRIKGINDSKKLSSSIREKLFVEIFEKALSVGVGIIGQDVIDDINILEATYLAMKNALDGLSNTPGLVLVDGWPIPGLKIRQVAVIGGDGKSAVIAAASIIAKVTRDRLMAEYSLKYPQYNFHKHKGYGTKEHKEALERFGPCPLHRKSFAPVRVTLDGGK
jgi:ribonuclease HII